MSEDILAVLCRILFYGATWGTAAAVVSSQCVQSQEERLLAAQLRRAETNECRVRSRGILNLMELRRQAGGGLELLASTQETVEETVPRHRIQHGFSLGKILHLGHAQQGDHHWPHAHAA